MLIYKARTTLNHFEQSDSDITTAPAFEAWSCNFWKYNYLQTASFFSVKMPASLPNDRFSQVQFFFLFSRNVMISFLFSVLSLCHSTNIAVFWVPTTFIVAMRVAVATLSVSSVPTPSYIVSCFLAILSPVEMFLTVLWCYKYIYLLICTQLLP